MRILGNILWFIFGGLEFGLLFAAEGLACMVTLIGIPFGLQWFKMVPLVFVPFGKGFRQCTVGDIFRLVEWYSLLSCRLDLLYNNSRDSIWKAVVEARTSDDLSVRRRGI